MRRALRIIGISSAITSILSMVILGYIYIEDILGYVKTKKPKWKLDKSENL